GVPGEGTPAVAYVETPGTYADGTGYSLRTPSYSIGALSFGPLDPKEMIGPRLAPQTVGLGLLAAVDESTILGFAAKNGGQAQPRLGREQATDRPRSLRLEGEPAEPGAAGDGRVAQRHGHHRQRVSQRELPARPDGVRQSADVGRPAQSLAAARERPHRARV